MSSCSLFLTTAVVSTLALLILATTLANAQTCAVKARVMDCKLAASGLPCNQRVQSPGKPCVELSTMKYMFQNTGSMTVRITSATRTINGASAVNLVNQVVPNPLAAGQTATIQEQLSINYCNPGSVQGIKIRAGGAC